MTGQAFGLSNGPTGKQGMLHVVLRDRVSGQKVIFAGTHLKAKAGEVRNTLFLLGWSVM